MHRAVPFALLILVPLSGCVGDASDDGASNVDSNGAATDPAPAGGSLNLPTGVKTISFERTGTEDIVVRFVADAGRNNQCSYRGMVDSNGMEGLAAALIVNDFGGGETGISLSAGNQEIHRDVGGGIAVSGNIDPEDGVYDVVIMVEGGEANADWSMFFRLDCDKPFDILTSEVAPLVGLFNAAEMGGGAAANGVIAGGGAMQSLTLTATTAAHAWLAPTAFSQGTWDVTHPNGTLSHSWNDLAAGFSDGQSLTGPAGEWTFELTELHWFGLQPWAALAEEGVPTNVFA